MKVAYWKEHNNFGDCLTPFLLGRLLNITATWSETKEAEFIGVGSYLDILDEQFSGTIWGTGMFGRHKKQFLNARILAVRGTMTAHNLGLDKKKTIIGDPGLLCSLFRPNLTFEYPVGIIAHWNDMELAREYKGHIISVTREIPNIFNETAKCQKIISSSLHGIILADAFGLPRMWHPSPNCPGGSFKFRDYQTALGGRIKPDVWYKANPEQVKKICTKLLEVLKKHYGD